MRALARSTRNEYHFYGGLEDFQGIKAFQGDDQVAIHPITFLQDEARGKMDFDDFNEAVSSEYDATIVLGNINMRGAWRAVKQARKNGLKTAFWTHGWLKKENWIKAKLRNFFFSRADHVLVYGLRAKTLAAKTGFDANRITTIWNSLDWEKQSSLFNAFSDIPRDRLRQKFDMPVDIPVILTISRVTDICRYDWLIDAAKMLRKAGNPVELWMIGDGPALDALKIQAREARVPLHTQGALYNEEIIAQQIMAADVVASPGKVGLTAMHALAYGTPIVTHSDYDQQMPEVEAITDGTSGSLFRYGSVSDLSQALNRVLTFDGDYKTRRDTCRASLEGRFTPEDQARLIDDAMDRLLNA
ncbi:glycosyltransferase family 4 protein [Celeribacter halophilus]|uniref:glycosyltransferase family 4 protein n=1 Tax=Celeribacter halophilus TaxID=576117 RepID=UPI003A9038E1